MRIIYIDASFSPCGSILVVLDASSVTVFNCSSGFNLQNTISNQYAYTRVLVLKQDSDGGVNKLIIMGVKDISSGKEEAVIQLTVLSVGINSFQVRQQIAIAFPVVDSRLSSPDDVSICTGHWGTNLNSNVLIVSNK